MKKQWITLPVCYMYKQEEKESVTIDPAVMDVMIDQLLAGQCSDQWKETGGILGCDSDGNIVTFHFDALGSWKSSACSYWPDRRGLVQIADQWNAEGIGFAGIIHTHSESNTMLSETDLIFTRELLKSNGLLEKLYMPVLAGNQLFVYAFERDFLVWAEQTPLSPWQQPFRIIPPSVLEQIRQAIHKLEGEDAT